MKAFVPSNGCHRPKLVESQLRGVLGVNEVWRYMNAPMRKPQAHGFEPLPDSCLASMNLLTSSDEYKLKAVREVLEGRLVKRNVPLKALTFKTIDQALGGTVRQAIELQKGIPSEKAREVVKVIKNAKIKVQAAIQGDQVRVSGKNKDDLQAVMRLLKETDFGIDMQFTNYR